MEIFDSVIVGGGPAGSTCARELTRAGQNVLVLDKSVFPRDKVCAGWITPQVVDTVALDVDDYRQGRTFQPISAFVAGLGTEIANNIAYDRTVSYGIRRCEFDDYLLRRSGASLRLGESLKSIERQADGWLLNGAIRARMLIGAGGHFCPVAQFLGAAVGRDEPSITAQEAEFELNDAQATSCATLPEKPELYFCEDLKGYAWCFRKGNFLNVGLGRDENRGLHEQLVAFWDWLAAQNKVPSDVKPRFKGHAYLLHTRSPRTIVDDRVLLIGDSVGLAYPESGEGIRPAIESGIMAAQVIIEAHGDFSSARLTPYETRLEARFGARHAARSIVPQNLKIALARGLMKTRWFSRKVVIDRWFLHTQQAALPASRQSLVTSH